MRKAKKQKATKDTVYGKNGVLYTFPQGSSGPININIDFSLAPPPADYYYADSVHLKTDEDLLMANLSFGRRKRDTDEFENRIDIMMPTPSLRQFWASSRDVETAVDLALAELNATSPRVKSISAGDSAAMTLFANMIFIAAGRGESSLDFYHLSTRDVHLARTKKMDMQLAPIVRVIMSTVLTKYFFGLVKPVAEDEQSSELTTPGRVRATATR